MDAVSTIQQEMKVEELLKYYHFDVSNSDGEFFRSRCKIHEGDNPTAFVINLDSGLWYCHTGDCGGGDIFTLVELMEGIDFPQAVHFLANFFNIDIKNLKILNKNKKRKDYVEEMKRFIHIIQESKVKSHPPYHLNATIKKVTKFRTFEKRTLNWFDLSFMEEGTFYKRNGETYQLKNRLLVPIVDNGKQIGVSIRRTKSNQSPKWLHQPVGLSTSTILYNSDELKSADIIVVVEGIFDAWAFHEIGIPSVAIFGSSISKKQQSILLKTGSTIVLAFDGDETGRKATKQSVKDLKNKTNIEVVEFDNGDDPERVTRRELEKIFRNRIKVGEYLRKEKS